MKISNNRIIMENIEYSDENITYKDIDLIIQKCIADKTILDNIENDNSSEFLTYILEVIGESFNIGSNTTDFVF